MRKPFAVIIPVRPCDMSGAVFLAASARAGGAAVETPLSHTRAERQMRRAKASGARWALTLDGDDVVVTNFETGRVSRPVSARVAGIVLAVWHRDAADVHTAPRDTVIDADFTQTTTVPRALAHAA